MTLSCPTRRSAELGDSKWAAVHEPLSGMWKDIARRTGITAPNLAATLAEHAGDLGAAPALFALGLAFDAARPGDPVLLAGYGSGCHALVFRADAHVPGAETVRPAPGACAALPATVPLLTPQDVL